MGTGLARVVHIPEDEAVLLNSREKAPYLICLEVLRCDPDRLVTFNVEDISSTELSEIKLSDDADIRSLVMRTSLRSDKSSVEHYSSCSLTWSIHAALQRLRRIRAGKDHAMGYQWPMEMSGYLGHLHGRIQ